MQYKLIKSHILKKIDPGLMLKTMTIYSADYTANTNWRACVCVQLENNAAQAILSILITSEKKQYTINT